MDDETREALEAIGKAGEPMKEPADGTEPEIVQKSKIQRQVLEAFIKQLKTNEEFDDTMAELLQKKLQSGDRITPASLAQILQGSEETP